MTAYLNNIFIYSDGTVQYQKYIQILLEELQKARFHLKSNFFNFIKQRSPI